MMVHYKSFRGGSFLTDPKSCHSAYRFNYSPVIVFDLVGFRIRTTSQVATMKLTDSIEIKTVDIPGTKYALSETTISQAQWRFVASLPKVDINLDPDPAHFKGDDLPVECVSWYQAIEFCKRLSIYMGEEVTLPTSDEWEYACRAGTTTEYNYGDEPRSNMMNCGEKTTLPVYSFPPNAWGLYQMHGNVWEWCSAEATSRYR